jgi:hypothetical protein
MEQRFAHETQEFHRLEAGNLRVLRASFASLRLSETDLTAKALSSREGRKVMFAVGGKNNSFAGGGRAA